MDTPQAAESVSCSISRGFHDWMEACGGSIVFSSYQANRLGTIGFTQGRVHPQLHPMPEPMGIAVRDQMLAVATGNQIVLMANAAMLAPHVPNTPPGSFDAVFLPRIAWHTGPLRAHDLAFGGQELWLVNTAFSCLAAPSPIFNFQPRWTPSFISRLVAEDRCHLNGLAMADQSPRFVTALGATDTASGWRANKVSGGILWDVPGQKLVLGGLSMPHSPRVRDDKLWILNSGAGELYLVDTTAGAATVVCTLPGFLRGLCFVGDYALVGLSQIRQSNLFGGLPVARRFQRLLCGIAIVDLRSGNPVGTLEFTSGIHEVYEVQFIPGCRSPTVCAGESRLAHQAIVSPTIAYWLSGQSDGSD